MLEEKDCFLRIVESCLLKRIERKIDLRFFISCAVMRRNGNKMITLDYFMDIRFHTEQTSHPLVRFGNPRAVFVTRDGYRHIGFLTKICVKDFFEIKHLLFLAGIRKIANNKNRVDGLIFTSVGV